MRLHEVDPPLVLGDRGVGAIGAEDDHVAALGLLVGGADDQVDVAGVRGARQRREIGDRGLGVRDRDRAVVVSVRTLLLAEHGAARGQGQESRVGLRARTQDEPGGHGRVDLVAAPHATRALGDAGSRDLDLAADAQTIPGGNRLEGRRVEPEGDPVAGPRLARVIRRFLADLGDLDDAPAG